MWQADFHRFFTRRGTPCSPSCRTRWREGKPGEANEDGQETDLAQNIPGPTEEDPLTLCEKGEMNQRLAEAITKLPEREQQVLMLYYQQEMTMREVGELMGVGESRVSQIHSQAVKHLRAVM